MPNRLPLRFQPFGLQVCYNIQLGFELQVHLVRITEIRPSINLDNSSPVIGRL